MTQYTHKWSCLVPYALVLPGVYMVLAMIFSLHPAQAADEMYIITTGNGAEIIVKSYTFTDERVEFITGNDLPGFIRKDDFVKISNMVGAPPKAPVPAETLDSQKDRESVVWLVSAAVIFVLSLLYLAVVTRKKKKTGQDDVDLYYGRTEKEPLTQGHLSFQYCGPFGRKSAWVIEVRRAYEEDGTFFIEGISTATGKRKTFDADRVDGLVTDLSSGRKAGIQAFFTDHAER